MCKKLFLFIVCVTFGTVAQAQQDTLRVYFGIDQSTVNNTDAKLLDKLAADQSVESISIYGYTDFLGSVEYNRVLSEKRSTNVKNYLVSKGVDKNIITVSKGMGIYAGSSESFRKDMADKGIQAHRSVMVVYTHKNGNHTPVSVSQQVTVDLSEENLEVGKNIVLENVFFYNNSDIFRPESYPTLELLLEAMTNNPTLKIEIQGYVCCVPSEDDINDDHGQYISDIRAKAVYNYLIRNGIDTGRMTHKGFGRINKRFPLERDEYEMNMNRRVEIMVLEK